MNALASRMASLYIANKGNNIGSFSGTREFRHNRPNTLAADSQNGQYLQRAKADTFKLLPCLLFLLPRNIIFEFVLAMSFELADIVADGNFKLARSHLRELKVCHRPLQTPLLRFFEATGLAGSSTPILVLLE